MVYLVDDIAAGGLPAERKPAGPRLLPDHTGRRTYIDYVYGGLVADKPEVHKAIADQYDYNMRRTLAGKKPLTPYAAPRPHPCGLAR